VRAGGGVSRRLGEGAADGIPRIVL
jgi:hypothetical protein